MEIYIDRWRIAVLTTSCTGIIIRRAGRVVVVSAGIGRRVGYIVRGQLATLTRFLRIGVCVSRERKVNQSMRVRKLMICFYKETRKQTKKKRNKNKKKNPHEANQS